jgi:hypothetical protein
MLISNVFPIGTELLAISSVSSRNSPHTSSGTFKLRKSRDNDPAIRLRRAYHDMLFGSASIFLGSSTSPLLYLTLQHTDHFLLPFLVSVVYFAECLSLVINGLSKANKPGLYSFEVLAGLCVAISRCFVPTPPICFVPTPPISFLPFHAQAPPCLLKLTVLLSCSYVIVFCAVPSSSLALYRALHMPSQPTSIVGTIIHPPRGGAGDVGAHGQNSSLDIALDGRITSPLPQVIRVDVTRETKIEEGGEKEEICCGRERGDGQC